MDDRLDKLEENIPSFLKLDKSDQKATVEALIFASDEPLKLKNLFNILFSIEQNTDNKQANGQTDIIGEFENKFDFTEEYIAGLIQEINNDLLETGRPFKIVEFAGGFQFATRKEYGELVHRLYRSKTRKRLSNAAMEALAVIAYKQPVTKPEIEQIRGVNSGEIVNSLIEKNLVRIAGRSEALGKPLLYATTDEFLKVFGLRGLEELPKLRELEGMENLPESILNSEHSDIVIDVENAGDLEGLSDIKFTTVEHVAVDNGVYKNELKNYIPEE